MFHRTMQRRWPLAVLAASLLLALPAGVAAQETGLDAARAGTDAFHDVAAAEAAGYGLPPEGPLHECIASLDHTGAMGLHYINGDRVGDTELGPAKPEALVYAPTAHGGRQLVALEYVVFAEAWDKAHDAPPSLFGQEFMFTDQPNRYELPPFYALHAWIWKDNPSGMFTSFNPDVSCEDLPDTATALAPTDIPAPAAAAGIALFVGGLWLAFGLALRRRRVIMHR